MLFLSKCLRTKLHNEENYRMRRRNRSSSSSSSSRRRSPSRRRRTRSRSHDKIKKKFQEEHPNRRCTRKDDPPLPKVDSSGQTESFLAELASTINLPFTPRWMIGFKVKRWDCNADSIFCWYTFAVQNDSNKKNTAKLYGDALVWSAVFIDWLDWFELVS